jgi:MFS family permease
MMTRTAERATQKTDDDGRVSGVGRAVIGAAVLAVAIGVGTALGAAVTDGLGLTEFVGSLLSALLCSAIAVPLILVLRRRWDRRPLSGIGLTGLRESTMAFLLGVAVTVGSAGVTLGAGTAAGWLRWGPFDLAVLLAFVITNGIVALLLEALPEEVSLRGYAWTALRERHRAVTATLVTTGLFLVVPGASIVIYAAVMAILTGESSPISIAPAGEDPLSYVVLLVVFGLTLIAARTARSSASLWTCIGTHLAFLTINRVTIVGQQREAGWSTEFTTPGAVFLVPAYLTMAALIYLVLAHRHRRRTS